MWGLPFVLLFPFLVLEIVFLEPLILGKAQGNH
jgi:hypothetical protein